MANNIFWIKGSWPGRPAIVTRPRGGDWLPIDVASWRAAGIDMVVSLLTPDEIADLELSDEGTACCSAGIAFRWFAINDRETPTSDEAAERLIAELAATLSSGHSIGIHCRQSVGRSALIAAAILVEFDLDAEKAIEQVGAARGLTVPETERQKQWIVSHAQGKRTAATPLPV